MSKSNVKYLHEVSQKTVKNGDVMIHEEYIIHGDKGLLIKHYHKEGDKKEKFVAKQIDDGTFVVKTMKNGTEETNESVSKEDLMKMMKKDKMLEFGVEYLKTQKGGGKNDQCGGKKRKGSRRTSKSKKGSKRTSKRRSYRKNR